MKFYGNNTDGITTIKNRTKFIEYLDSIRGDFEIKVTPTKDIRSLEMNNRYWWWLSLLSDFSGYTKSELHNYFKTRLLCIEDMLMGEKVINCKSTSELTIKEFGEYLINVGRIASESFSYYLPESQSPSDIL